MENQRLTLLKSFEENSNWFHKNIDLIRKKGFTGKFVAIKSNKVISSGESMDNLMDSLEKEGENPSYLFIEFVHPEGYVLLL